ncbi:armadillo-type protein [Lobosporangium transversale]|uniref:Armadillo-type protein n=1 Tax=Lobosporangium transversale TaxID=64571 RepID=A0A1Y2GZ22_9FUNG|nr:armadillo-type protein [Lobosporangium transversale]ORZ27537.1 armadillo-type protein [Lobosporangium transversale]|eukprot:XP_021885264.1 armadillo-type protein [Lobosporangium transversale]
MVSLILPTVSELLAYVVSKIAHHDWPEQWTNLLDVLVHHLKNGSANEVHGSMRVLTEFVNKDVTHVQLPLVAPVLFPELLRILVSDQLYSHATRSRCASIFRNAVEMLYTIKEEHPEAVKVYLTPFIGQWNEAFIAILNTRTADVPEIEVGEWGLKTEILKCINLSIQGFPKLMAPYLLQVLSAVWQDVLHLRSRYISEYVNTGEGVGESFQDSDGETIGFESLLFVQFEFIQMACRRRKVTQVAFIGEDGKSGILPELVWNTLNYMQMTDDQVESWTSDPNQFIADEEDDSYSFNVRIAAEDLLMTLIDNFEAQTLDALNLSVKQEASRSANEKAAGNINWWKAQESSLLAVGLFAGDLSETIKSGAQAPIDIGGLFEHIVLGNLSEHDFPFLQGRSFVFASQFASILPANYASQYVSAAVEAIMKSPSAVVKVSALRALNNFNQYLDKQYIIPYQRSIIQGVAPMMEITTEDTFSLIIRTLISTSKINEQAAAEFESTLGPLVLDSWVKYPADHLISMDIMDLFETLAANQYMHPALNARALPVLTNMISTENPDKARVSSTVDLLKALVSGASTPLPPKYVAQFFHNLMSVLLTTDDRDVLQSGQECLTIVIQKDVQQIAGWRDEVSGKTGLDLIIQFIAKLLDPSQTESAALFVGDLISKLIKKGGDLVSPILPELLNAVTLRLADAKLPTFIQPLVMVFAQLSLNQHDVVINFLSGLNINGRNGLDIVMASWLGNHADFTGLYNQKVSTVALTKIFMSGDPRIATVQVNGDLIVPTSTRIVTRSRAKTAPDQFTVTTVPVKIIRLLATDLINKVEEEEDQAAESDYDDDDGDDDWEDEDNGRKDKFSFLSDVLDSHGIDMDGDEEEDEADPDVLADPVYQLNMKNYLIDFFRQCVQQNSPAFVQSVGELNDVEKRTLSSLLEN